MPQKNWPGRQPREFFTPTSMRLRVTDIAVHGERAECKGEQDLQTKLTIGASSDPLELEADRVADQAMAADGRSCPSNQS